MLSHASSVLSIVRERSNTPLGVPALGSQGSVLSDRKKQISMHALLEIIEPVGTDRGNKAEAAPALCTAGRLA